MTNKTTIPEPVAWLHEEGNHIITAAEKRAANATFTRYGQGLITTTAQAEAYADTRVRKVLEEAARLCRESQSKAETEGRILALIQQESKS